MKINFLIILLITIVIGRSKSDESYFEIQRRRFIRLRQLQMKNYVKQFSLGTTFQSNIFPLNQTITTTTTTLPTTTRELYKTTKISLSNNTDYYFDGDYYEPTQSIGLLPIKSSTNMSTNMKNYFITTTTITPTTTTTTTIRTTLTRNTIKEEEPMNLVVKSNRYIQYHPTYLTTTTTTTTDPTIAVNTVSSISPEKNESHRKQIRRKSRKTLNILKLLKTLSKNQRNRLVKLWNKKKTWKSKWQPNEKHRRQNTNSNFNIDRTHQLSSTTTIGMKEDLIPSTILPTTTMTTISTTSSVMINNSNNMSNQCVCERGPPGPKGEPGMIIFKHVYVGFNDVDGKKHMEQIDEPSTISKKYERTTRKRHENNHNDDNEKMMEKYEHRFLSTIKSYFILTHRLTFQLQSFRIPQPLVTKFHNERQILTFNNIIWNDMSLYNQSTGRLSIPANLFQQIQRHLLIVKSSLFPHSHYSPIGDLTAVFRFHLTILSQTNRRVTVEVFKNRESLHVLKNHNTIYSSSTSTLTFVEELDRNNYIWLALHGASESYISDDKLTSFSGDLLYWKLNGDILYPEDLFLSQYRSIDEI
ncbi:hypothetical protein SNEBB_008394 [Seison nebaliae]|nr:hypothetical protein SNEBB_008394 [Seison nebaliae]